MTDAKTEKVDTILQGLLGRITTADQAKPNLKMMIYSEPGGRKTSFGGTIPGVLMVDVEKGLTSLKNLPHIDPAKVSVLPYKSWFQIEALVEKMSMDVPELEQFTTLFIDSMSELHKKGLAEITEREFAVDNTRNRYVAETEDHSENNEHIRRLVSSLRDLDRNIVLTSHARSVQQKDKSIKIYPDFSEKLANTLSGIMDVVAFIEKKEIDGELRTVWWFESDGYVMAKNRIGLPAKLVDPTWDTIWGYFEKHNASNPAQ